MTPEARARHLIDSKLEAAGWIVQDIKQQNLGSGKGIAVLKYPTDSGPADYLLFIDRHPVGVIEAKKRRGGREPQSSRSPNQMLCRSFIVRFLVRAFASKLDFRVLRSTVAW